MKVYTKVKYLLAKSLRGTAGIFAFLYVFLCFKTSRIVVRDDKNLLEYIKNNPAVVSIWHNTILIATPFFSYKMHNKQKFALVSASKDASFLRTIFKFLRLPYIKGSTKKISVLNIRRIFSLLKEERGLLFITPDGPVGPRMNFNYGAAQIAITTSTPVLLLYFGIKNGIALNTWDRLLIPRPFSTITAVLGDLVHPDSINSNTSNLSKIEKIEKFRAHLEKNMRVLTSNNDRKYNFAIVLPEDSKQTRRYNTSKTKKD